MVFSTTLLPTWIAAADLTSNGLDDLVLANTLDNSVTIVFQTAPGQFSWSLTLPVGLAPSDITFADVNGDGLLDILVTDQASGDVTLLLNDATHSFETIEHFRAGTSLYGLDTTSGTPALSSLEQSVTLVAGNFTGDDLPDVAVVNSGTHSFSLLQNDGQGGFTDPQAALTTSTSEGFVVDDDPGPIVAGQFFGPNQPLDLAILMEGINQVWIYQGDGAGHFTLTDSTITVGSLSTGLTAVQDSQTGNMDLLVGNESGDILRLVGNGKGQFLLPPPPPADRTALAVQNPNGGGDVLVADQKDNLVTLQVRPSNSEQYTPVGQPLAPSNSSQQLAPGVVAWYRLDKSGLLDALVLASGSNRLLVYHTVRLDASGNPVFAASGPDEYFVGTNPIGLTIQVINGIPAIFIANQGSDDVSILFGSV